MSIKDFIRFRLTGEFACEMTDASSGCLLNLHTKEFDSEIFKALGIEDCRRLMPPCLESTAVSGCVTEAEAKRTDLAAGGYFDIDAGALASGVLGPDVLCLIAGTWSINEYLRSEANTDYDKNCNTVTLSFLSGYFMVEDSSPTSASNFDWYVRTFLEPGHPGHEIQSPPPPIGLCLSQHSDAGIRRRWHGLFSFRHSRLKFLVTHPLLKWEFRMEGKKYFLSGMSSPTAASYLRMISVMESCRTM